MTSDSQSYRVIHAASSGGTAVTGFTHPRNPLAMNTHAKAARKSYTAQVAVEDSDDDDGSVDMDDGRGGYVTVKTTKRAAAVSSARLGAGDAGDAGDAGGDSLPVRYSDEELIDDYDQQYKALSN